MDRAGVLQGDPADTGGSLDAQSVEGQPLGSKYVIHEVVGRGGMGTVHRGEVRATGESVAVKVLRPDLASDPTVVARFIQERTILTSLHDEHLVAVRDLVVEGDSLAIVMDLVSGADLRRHLRDRGTLTPARAVDLTVQTLRGLSCVHAAGVVHRDVKPENVLLEPVEGGLRARLTDFGVSRVAQGSSLTRMTGLIGTPEYLAPELAEREHATPAADLYSTGIMFYELLAGRTPFAGGHPVAVLRRHLEVDPPPIVGLDPRLSAIIAALLAKEPEARPDSAAAVADELELLMPELEHLPALSPQGEPNQGGWTPSLTGATVLKLPPPTVDEAPEAQTQLSIKRSDVRAQRSAEAAPRRRGRRAVAALPVAVVALAVVVLFTQLRGSDQAASAPAPAPTSVSYAFSPAVLANGLAVGRAWQLSGSSGSTLTEQLSLTNTTAGPVHTSFVEVVPKQIASDVKQIAFRPEPTSILETDPIVAFGIDAAPGEIVQISYTVAVTASGLDPSRLATWATDYASAVAAYEKSSGTAAVQLTLTELAVTPSSISGAPGAVTQLTASGRMSNGTDAPTAVLASVSWTSSNPNVATVSKTGLVTAMAAGSAEITVQAGGSKVVVPVAIAGAATAPAVVAVGQGQPQPTPTTRAPSPSPAKTTPKATPKPTPKATPKPTPKPTPTPTPPPSHVPVVMYDCSTASPAGHYIKQGQYWQQSFVANGAQILGGLVSIGANNDGRSHIATVGIYGSGGTGNPLATVSVDATNYAMKSFNLPSPLAVTKGQTYFLTVVGAVNDFTAYDSSCFVGQVHGLT